MKTLIIILLVVQVICLTAGIYMLSQGDLFFGLFNTIINGLFIPVNIQNLRDANN